MEETLSLISHGCELSKELESNLTNLADKPTILLNSCDQIVRVFKSAIDRLASYNQPSYPQPWPLELDAGVQEWLRSTNPHPMDLLQAQLLADKNLFDAQKLTESKKKRPELGLDIPSTTTGVKILELGATDMGYVGDTEGSSRSRGGREFQMTEGSDSGKSPGSQRSRKRKDMAEKFTVRMAAPRIGNTEIPPDDGFTWRKYGQKEILGSRYPRGYYRCTHKTFYGCEAKKQAQRLDDDPNTFEVTYHGHHTCHMSSTAPSLSVPRSTDIKQEMQETTQPPPSTSISLTRWLSVDSHSMDVKDTNTLSDSIMRMYRGFELGGGESSSGAVTATATTAQMHQEGKEVEFPVVDLADAMFNSGSSSNSMDVIFHMADDK